MNRARLIGYAVSPAQATFAPLLFSGRLEEAVHTARELGLSCIELSVRDPAMFAAVDVQALVGSAGLVVSAVATGQACLVDGLCLAAADDATRVSAVERFSAQIRLAAELDAVVILGGVRGRLGALGAEGERRRAAAVDAIRLCADVAVAAGVEVMLEPINRYETDFVRTAEEGLQLIEEVGSPALRLLLDCFHMNIEERDFATTIRRVGDRLGYVHLADSNREAPGQGHINFGEVFQALDDTGYSGPLVAEVLPLPDDLTAARRAASFLLGARSSL
ncbi:MAG: sugar phosphate isomerase/epimerase family protein [Acidimicrobiales bacterium]